MLHNEMLLETESKDNVFLVGFKIIFPEDEFHCGGIIVTSVVSAIKMTKDLSP